MAITLIVTVRGVPQQTARLRVLKKSRRALPRIHAEQQPDTLLKARSRAGDFRDYQVSGAAIVRLKWS